MMDPTDHDAPVITLLSIKHNPLVAGMSKDQLTELVTRLRADKRKSAPPKPATTATSKAARYQALLDTL